MQVSTKEALLQAGQLDEVRLGMVVTVGRRSLQLVPEHPAVISPPTRHTTTNGISKCHDILIIASLTAV